MTCPSSAPLPHQGTDSPSEEVQLQPCDVGEPEDGTAGVPPPVPDPAESLHGGHFSLPPSPYPSLPSPAAHRKENGHFRGPQVSVFVSLQPV